MISDSIFFTLSNKLLMLYLRNWKRKRKNVSHDLNLSLLESVKVQISGRIMQCHGHCCFYFRDQNIFEGLNVMNKKSFPVLLEKLWQLQC